MTPSSVIVLGGEVPQTYNNVPSLLIRMPGESGPCNANVIAPQSLDDCLLYLRLRFADHQSIASLGGTLILKDHPIEGTGEALPPMVVDHSPHAVREEWAPRIEEKLCEILDDLGNCPLDTWKGALHTIQNGNRIAECPSSRELMYAHAGEPAIVLGAGPSASDFLDHIAKIRSGVRLFVADTMLRGCLARGIVPDYVCAIERAPNITKVLSADAECGATLIASPVVEPDCIRPWGNRVLFWWGADDLFRWLDPSIEPMPSGRSSGTLALAAAAHAGCSTIYLVGHDLAYRGGKSHAEDAHPIAHAANHKADQDASPVNPNRQRFFVEGNHGGKVETNGLWCRIKGDLEGIIANHPNWKVWNVCNEEGARIAGAPTGQLPMMPPTLSPLPELPASGVESAWSRVTSVRVALLEAKDKLEAAHKSLKSGLSLDFLSEQLAASRIFGSKHAPLFQYVTRSIYNNMTLRLHYHQSLGRNDTENHASVLQLTIKTLHALCDRMLKDLP